MDWSKVKYEKIKKKKNLKLRTEPKLYVAFMRNIL